MAKQKDEKSNQLIVPPELITREQFTKRQKAWNKYYEKVPGTRAYKRYQEMKKAFRDNDMKTVKKLQKEAHDAIIADSPELAKPPYKEPKEEERKGRLGVKEYWESQIRIAKKDGKEIIYKDDAVRDTLDIPTQAPTF
jgi:hypothetical protein